MAKAADEKFVDTVLMSLCHRHRRRIIRSLQKYGSLSIGELGLITETRFNQEMTRYIRTLEEVGLITVQRERRSHACFFNPRLFERALVLLKLDQFCKSEKRAKSSDSAEESLIRSFTDAVFYALANHERRAIIRQLAKHDMIMTELSEREHISSQQMSRHIKSLKDIGVVEVQEVGHSCNCSLNRRGLKKALRVVTTLPD